MLFNKRVELKFSQTWLVDSCEFAKDLHQEVLHLLDQIILCFAPSLLAKQFPQMFLTLFLLLDGHHGSCCNFSGSSLFVFEEVCHFLRLMQLLKESLMHMVLIHLQVFRHFIDYLLIYNCLRWSDLIGCIIVRGKSVLLSFISERVFII